MRAAWLRRFALVMYGVRLYFERILTQDFGHNDIALVLQAGLGMLLFFHNPQTFPMVKDDMRLMVFLSFPICECVPVWRFHSTPEKRAIPPIQQCAKIL